MTFNYRRLQLSVLAGIELWARNWEVGTAPGRRHDQGFSCSRSRHNLRPDIRGELFHSSLSNAQRGPIQIA